MVVTLVNNFAVPTFTRRRGESDLPSVIRLKCRARVPRGTVTNSAEDIGDGILSGTPRVSVTGTLCNGVTKLGMCRKGNSDTRGIPSLDVRKGVPLVLMSNFPHSLSSVDGSRVRSVRVLGSTITSTLCKIENKGNIVLIAAGHKRSSGLGMATGCRCNVDDRFHGPRFTSTCACTGDLGATLTLSKLGAHCRPGRLSTFGGGACPCRCPGIG